MQYFAQFRNGEIKVRAVFKDLNFSLKYNLLKFASSHILNNIHDKILEIFLFTDYYASLRLPRWYSGKESACIAGDSVLTSGSGRSPGGGHGNPLQYSYLENSMDRGPWQSTVHSVAKSWTWLKWLSMQAYTYLLFSDTWIILTCNFVYIFINDAHELIFAILIYQSKNLFTLYSLLSWAKKVIPLFPVLNVVSTKWQGNFCTLRFQCFLA